MAVKNLSKKRNGFIDIRGSEEISQTNTGDIKTINFPITFTQTTPMCTTGVARPQDDGLPQGTVNIRLINNSKLTFGFVISATYVKGAYFVYDVRGY